MKARVGRECVVPPDARRALARVEDTTRLARGYSLIPSMHMSLLDDLDRRAAAAWSGGKDCCLAVCRAREAGIVVGHLVTMTTPDGQRSRSNGVSIDVLRAQAAAMGATLVAVPAQWDTYEAAFVAALHELRRAGVREVVFGDMAGEAHRAWNERVCATAGLRAQLPLWGDHPADVLAALTSAGVQARVTAARAGLLDPKWLSRRVARPLVRELLKRRADPCGERGEYHTVATAAPCFSAPIRLRFGVTSLRHGYWHREAHIESRRRLTG